MTISYLWHTLQRAWDGWQTFWSIYRAYERAEDLIGLCRWADKKRLRDVGQAYRYKLVVELNSLRGSSLYMPLRTNLAIWLYKFNKFMFPPPPYYTKGSASRFKTKFSNGRG